jgi:hypothetical protein
MAEYLRSRHAVAQPILVRSVAWIIERQQWRNLPVMLTAGTSCRVTTTWIGIHSIRNTAAGQRRRTAGR